MRQTLNKYLFNEWINQTKIQTLKNEIIKCWNKLLCVGEGTIKKGLLLYLEILNLNKNWIKIILKGKHSKPRQISNHTKNLGSHIKYED